MTGFEMVGIIFFFLWNSCLFAYAQNTKWYYTRKLRNHDHPKDPKFFPGSNFNYRTLFSNGTNDLPILFGGSMVLIRENDPNSHFDSNTIHYLIQNTTLIPKEAFGQQISTVFAVQYNLFIINDYSNYPTASNISDLNILEEEIGLYDHSVNQFIEKKWRYIRLGIMVATTVKVTSSQKGNSYEEHNIISTADMAGKPTVLYHTWNERIEEGEGSSFIGKASEEVESEISFPNPPKVRIMTYNLWHNNPPSWIYHVRRLRWDRYTRRLRHFAEMIVQQDPDIITVQEVRLDASFFAPIGRVVYEDVTGEYSKFDGGSQVEHLLSHLRAAWHHLRGPGSYPNYQLVYHPAMLLKEREKINIRNEEGLLILSKYPIITSEILLLSREVGNPDDDHQRVVLLAQIEVPTKEQQSTLVTVATTHFSLSDQARNRAVEEIKHFFAENDWVNLSALQVFTGDLNAEPSESAIQALSHDNFQFVDTWLALHEENSDGFTFPACNPVKRIDYIFAKKNNNLCQDDSNSSNDDASPPSSSCAVRVLDSFIAGKEPTEDTKHLVNSREGLGMNDADSPIWASDHFALITDLSLE